MISINEMVGRNCANKESDVRKVLKLLNQRKSQSQYSSILSEMNLPEFGGDKYLDKLIEALKVFQKKFQKMKNPDGIVSPKGSTILFLGGIRSLSKTIVVDLDSQNLYAYDGARLKYEFYCASGDNTHPTAVWPSEHKIFRKHKIYRSRAYNAQMNYAMFFTYDGKAIHQSNAVGFTSLLKNVGINALGSHGCVRLSEDDAKVLFEWAPMGTTVFVDLEML